MMGIGTPISHSNSPLPIILSFAARDVPDRQTFPARNWFHPRGG